MLGSGATTTEACNNYGINNITVYAPIEGGVGPNVGEYLYLTPGNPPTNSVPDGYYSNGIAFYIVSGGLGQITSVDLDGCDGLLTPTPTPTSTITPTNTETPTLTPTNTLTPTVTPTNTLTPTVTPSTTLVTSGLIMDWDIQNNSSYNGTGSVITDLQGNINGEMTGTISYTNSSPKYLTIEGGAPEYINTSDINPYLSPVNTGTTQSIFLWIYPTSNGVIYSEQGSLSPETIWHDVQIQRDSSGRFLFGVWPYVIDTPPITSSIAHALNNWYYVGWTYNGTTLTAYVNGTMVGISTYPRSTPYNDGGSAPMYFNFGYPDSTDLTTTTSACSYRLGAVQIYNIGLSGAQVLQNFNTTKTNYGI